MQLKAERDRCIVVYLSCLGTVEMTGGFMARADALAVVEYLRRHPDAKPLYLINVRKKEKRND